jgi:hypothetical protein
MSLPRDRLTDHWGSSAWPVGAGNCAMFSHSLDEILVPTRAAPEANRAEPFLAADVAWWSGPRKAVACN